MAHRALLLTLLLGCEPRGSFSENVAAALRPCAPDEVLALVARERIQLALAPCGSNQVLGFDWSPDGVRMAFQLTSGVYVLNGVAHTLAAVPVDAPAGPPAWVRDDLLAVPLAPRDPGGSARLALYSPAAGTLRVLPLSVSEPEDLGAWGVGDQVVLTGIGDDGVRHAWTVDPATERNARALMAVAGPVRALVVSRAADRVAWADDAGVVIARLSDGAILARIAGVQRAIPHPDGRHVALQTPGAPIPLFDQGSLDDLSPEARARAEERERRWLDRLPDATPRTVQPPEIQILDMETGRRQRFTGIYGDHLSWYAARPDYASVVLWGVRGRQVNRNVALADLMGRVREESSADLAPVQ